MKIEIDRRMKLVFLDTEYTGEHAYATLVSLGLATLEGESLYLTLNDYDQDQVTDWLRDNVLNLIDESQNISSFAAYQKVSQWLEAYSAGDQIHLVSAGLGSDLLLLFELWRFARPELKYFHALHCLPAYLNHAKHFDLNTLFFVAGVNPDINRESFINYSLQGERHHALYDAQVVRECFLKLIKQKELHQFIKCLQ